jgi:hypothetical protein
MTMLGKLAMGMTDTVEAVPDDPCPDQDVAAPRWL